MSFLKSLWLILTNPIERAEELYQLAQAKLAAQEAETRFQLSRQAYYQAEVMLIDPSTDWWRYAQYKDKISEHRKLVLRSLDKQKTLRSRYVACEKRWRKLRKDLGEPPEPTLHSCYDTPPDPKLWDAWVDSHLVLRIWNGESWVES